MIVTWTGVRAAPQPSSSTPGERRGGPRGRDDPRGPGRAAAARGRGRSPSGAAARHGSGTRCSGPVTSRRSATGGIEIRHPATGAVGVSAAVARRASHPRRRRPRAKPCLAGRARRPTPTAARPTPGRDAAARRRRTPGRVRGHRAGDRPGDDTHADPGDPLAAPPRAPARTVRGSRSPGPRPSGRDATCWSSPVPRAGLPRDPVVPRLARPRRVRRAAADAAPVPRARRRGRDAPDGRRAARRRVRAPPEQHRRRQRSRPRAKRPAPETTRRPPRCRRRRRPVPSSSTPVAVAIAVARRVLRHLTAARTPPAARTV